MSNTTHHFNRPRTTDLLDDERNWFLGEDYLPAYSPERKILWRALEQAGAQVGEVYEQEGTYPPIRHVVLPEGWTKHPNPVMPNRLEVYDASDNLRLYVDCYARCSIDFSNTAMVGRYLVRVEKRNDEYWAVVLDRWGVRAKGAVYRVLHQEYTNSASPEAHREMGERWLDKHYAGWRYPALTWDLSIPWWQRLRYISYLKQIKNGVIKVCR